MTVTIQRFLLAFPEFSDTRRSLINQKMIAASERIAADTWGELADQGQMYLMAHLLSVSPEGEQARLKKENRGTVYGIEYENLRRAVTVGLGRVI